MDTKYWKNTTDWELPGEVWKDVVGYEGYYEVSNLGRVRGVDRIVTGSNVVTQHFKGHLMTQRPDGNGYMLCHLRMNRTRRMIHVHRMVAEAFIPNPDNLPQVNHKDNSRTNSQVDNLEWCTVKYNSNYGLHKKRASFSRAERYRAVFPNGTEIYFRGQKQIQEYFHRGHTAIGRWIKSPENNPYGIVFERLERGSINK